MSITVRNPYEEPESSTTKWVVLFILLSLLAHALIIAAIILVTVFMPVPKMVVPPPANPEVTLSLMPTPAPPPKPIFIPTTPDANAKHKPQQVESANDTDLKSRSKTARLPDSIMPDVNGKPHNPDLNNAPKVQSPQKPEVSSTPPTPKSAQPQKPTPPQPKPQPPQPTPPKPTQPATKPLPPTPPQKAPPQLDANGLPVLPPINAQTMAQQNPSLVSPPPAVSQPQQAASVHGALGRQGDNSPAAMASELGKYKQYVYSVVGSYWYPDIDKHFGTIGVGTVHIQFTIHSDGTITDVAILEGDNLEILKGISRNALVSPAPFKPFNEALIKQVGDSYTDDFTFSVY